MMTDHEIINMECPECKAKQDVTVWHRLDVRTDPAARDALFSWQINVFTCDSCDFKALLPVELLYDDPDRQIAIQYYPVDALGQDDFYSGFNKHGEPISTEANMDKEDYLKKPHMVFDMGEMLRYIVFKEVAFEKGK